MTTPVADPAPSSRRRPVWYVLACVLAVVVAAGLLRGWQQVREARERPELMSAVSPDAQWFIRLRLIDPGEPMRVLVQVHGADRTLQGEMVRPMIPGAADEAWDCGPSGCRAFRFALGADGSVALPPGGLARWRARLP